MRRLGLGLVVTGTVLVAGGVVIGVIGALHDWSLVVVAATGVLAVAIGFALIGIVVEAVDLVHRRRSSEPMVRLWVDSALDDLTHGDGESAETYTRMAFVSARRGLDSERLVVSESSQDSRP